MPPVGSVGRFTIQKFKYIMARITASLGLLFMCVLSQGLSSALFKYLLFLNMEEGIHNIKSAAFEQHMIYSISTILLRTMFMTGKSSTTCQKNVSDVMEGEYKCIQRECR